MYFLFAAAHLLLAWALSSRIWTAESRDPLSPLERACAALTIGTGLWLSIDWLLAFLHMFTREALLVRGTLVIAAALFFGRGIVRALGTPVRLSGAAVGSLATIGTWLVFILWRGTVTPPLSHDVLSNHLPRAVLYWRHHGWIDLTQVSPAFRDMPANYELLLADMLVLMRHDRVTEWLSTFFYVSFVLCGATVAWRWWRSRAVSLLVALLLAGSPIALLHSGADKNDLLVATFMTAALVWAGRYWASGDFASLLLLGVSLFIAFGTKPQAAFLGAALMPLILWRMWRDWRSGAIRVPKIAGAIVFALVAALLLGAHVYVDQYLRKTPPAAVAKQAWPARQVRTMAWFDWDNLWQAPYVLVAAPFSPSAFNLPVPWDSRPWFWKRYEIFFSHFGAPFALCLAGAPFAVAAWRERENRRERVAIAAAVLVALAINLPVYLRPHGAFIISLPRYAMYIAVPVLAWTAGALLVSVRRRVRYAPALLFVVGGLSFGMYAVDMAVNDSFAPLDYVLLARQYPNTRFIPFDSGRATSRVDEIAGPNDVIAADVNFGGWIHPLFGVRLTRPVYFIPPTGESVRIPHSADWVVVERMYDVIWGNPRMKSLADARRFFFTNRPKREHTRVFRAVVRNPEFRLIWANPALQQAIFQRVRPSDPQGTPTH